MVTVIGTVTLATDSYLGPPLTALTPVVVDETDPYIAGLLSGNYIVEITPPTDPPLDPSDDEWVANPVDFD